VSEERAIPVSGVVILLPWPVRGTALVLLLIAILPTMSSGFSSQTISFIIIVGPSALVILTHIFVEEVIRERSLISYVLHFSLCDVALAIMMEPIAWSGLFCVLAMRAAALISIFARVVPRPYHVDAERGTWLAALGVDDFYHVNGGEGLGVYLHGVLVEN
jgi:hypothetical protein